MSETNGANAQAIAPQINTLAQYMKDFSFENPNSPQSLQPQEKQANISYNVNVNVRQLAEADFEVSLKIEGSAGESPLVLFKFELDYAGIFRLMNVPQEHIHPVVMIECPRILFPFARQIVADGVRNGGFPPFYLEMIDFVRLYQQNLEQNQPGPGVMAS
jgi:preprotein translocase subunit SecB